MRIIGGHARGMKLFSPRGMNTRPMPDRIKESLFNILRDRVYNAVVLDLFAGSGSLGLEALSRGAQACYFVEKNAEVAKTLQRNIDKGQFRAAHLICGNAFKIHKRLPEVSFDLCFFDPPYKYFDNPVDRRNCIAFLQQIAIKHAPINCLLLHYRAGAMAGMTLPDTFIPETVRKYGTAEIMLINILTKC